MTITITNTDGTVDEHYCADQMDKATLCESLQKDEGARAKFKHAVLKADDIPVGGGREEPGSGEVVKTYDELLEKMASSGV